VKWLTELYQQYSSVAIFLAVYITEAHAADEWPVGPQFSFCKQPKTTSERLSLAKDFISRNSYRVPLLVDDISNHASTVFAAWPFRFYVLSDGAARVALKAEPRHRDYAYSIGDLNEWLAAYARNQGIHIRTPSVAPVCESVAA